MKSIIRGIFLSLALIFTFTTCENPVGLGAKVNTEKPVIRNAGDENQPGSFIQGNGNRIWLDVEQEFGISKVFMEIEYINKTTGETERKTIDAYYDEERKQWYVDLDTSDMEDGTIKAWVTAIDINGNTTTTTDIVYFVKNTPPQIKLNMPLVDDKNWDDDAFLNDLKNVDPLYLGFELMGLATDNYGIEKGYPKIMIWPAPDQDISIQLGTDGLPLPGDGRYGTYRSLVVPNERDGLTATKFTWPMMYLVQDPSAPGGYRLPTKEEPNRTLNQGIYRISIIVKDLFGNENFYPNRTDTTRGPDNPPPKFIEINYKVSDVPLIQYSRYPQYYNAVNDFELYFSVSSQTQVTSVIAYIVDTNDLDKEKIIGGPYTPEFLPSDSSGSAYKYKLTIPAAQAKAWVNKPSNGIMFAKIKATAGDKTGPDTYQNFIFDDKPPNVTIDRPVNLINTIASGVMETEGGAYEILYPDKEKPKWVTGTITFGGSVDDNLTMISNVYFHFGKLDDDNKADAQRAAIYNSAEWTNTDLQYTPHADGWSGSLYSWTYTFTPFDKDYKTNAGASKAQEKTDLISGYFIGDDQYIGTSGKSRFYLPVYVKIEDSAGNFKIVHYKLCVDPELDEPVVTITQPAKNATVGGTVRIAGYAEDNFWMHTVLIRVKRNDNNYPSLDPPVNKDGNYYLPPGVLKFYNEHPSYPKPVGNDTAGWFETTKIGDSSMINWWVNINGDKALEPPSSSAYGTTVDVTIEAVALDCDERDATHKTTWKVGPIESWALKFSKDVPSISIPVISKDGMIAGMAERTYTDSMKVSGTFTFSFDVEAVENIKSLEVRVNNSSTPVRLVTDTSQQSVTSWTVGPVYYSGDKAKRSISVTINSITGGGVITPVTLGSSANLTLEVEAVDNTSLNLRTTNTFNLGIDNFYPTAEIQTSQVASENIAASKYFYVEGKAKDYGDGSGNIQGIERVLVYFEYARIDYDNYSARTGRKITGNTNYIKLKPNVGIAGQGDFVSYPNVMNHNGPATVSPLPTPATYDRFPVITQTGGVWKSEVAMVIDYQEGGGTADGDLDGTEGETWGGSPADRDFGARVNFSGWKDGPYIVHYLVMDQAGNATHYYKDIYLENNKPRITSINLGTDINGDNDVTTSSPLNEYLWTTDSVISAPSGSQQYGQMSPATSSTRPESTFRVRGNRFDVRLGVENGNGTKEVLINYATPITNISATGMNKGIVYTIVSQGSGATYTDFTKYGAPNNIEGTTFVATGAPLASSGAGTVTPYNLTNLYTGPMSETIKTFPYEEFGSGITDSPKYVSGDSIPSGFGIGDVKTHNQRYFIIRVRDSTLASLTNTGTNDPDLDNLVDALLLKMDVDNTDAKAPTITVLPFGQEYTYDSTRDPPMNTLANDKAKFIRDLADTNAEYIRNIGMNGAEKGGYVQYAYTTYPAINPDPMTTAAYISGKVKFLGKAEDNQRIGEIWVTIPGYNDDTKFQIAKANSSTGLLEAVPPLTPQAGQWEFKLDSRDYLSLDYGHTLNWEFMWDSSYVSTLAQNNVTITFEVRDASSPKGGGGTVRSNTSQIKVNIVPYISDVVTSLSSAYASTPSAFSRSALGGYPVRETEPITIKGFNLGDFTANTTANNVKIGTVDFTISTSGRTRTSINGTVPASAVSGELVIMVNSIPSFNNSSSKNKNPLYNQEKNGVNNDKLDNSRYLYVWKTGSMSNDPVANMNTPFMRMDSAGNRYLSYGYYGTSQSSGALKVQKNNAAGLEIGAAYSNRMINTTVAIGGNGSFYAAGTDLSSAYNNNRGFQLARSNTDGSAQIDTARNNAFGAIRIISMYNSISDRFKIPRIAIQPTNGSSARTDNYADRVLMSFYDEVAKEIRVIYGNVGSTYSYNTSQAGAQGGTSNLTPSATPTDGGVAPMAASATLVTNNGSMYTACGLLSNGVPVIAWFDSLSNKLYFSYDAGYNVTYPLTKNLSNTSRVATDSTRWESNKREIDKDGKGTDVDLIVDPDDNIHLAYYDASNGGLWYAFIAANNGNTDNARPTGSLTKVKVDTFLSAGTNLMINLRKDGSWYVPYITYYHGSFTKTKNSIRVAWQKSSTLQAGCDDNNKFTGHWEVMTVPAEKTPTLDFVCNGVPTTTSWTKPTGTWPDSLQKSILVGYFTSDYYEGAVLKDDMTITPSILQK